MRPTNIFQTYIHISDDTKKVFYVGVGGYYRPWDRTARSPEWKAIAKKGYSVEVVANWNTREESFAHEALLIQYFHAAGHPIINKSTGGYGGTGRSPSKEMREKLRALYSGVPLKIETRQRMSTSRMGKSLSPSHCENIRLGKLQAPKLKCLTCGMVTHPGPLARHQKASEHTGISKE